MSSPWARAGALQRHPLAHVPTAPSGDAPSAHSVSSACSLCPPSIFTALEDGVSGAIPPSGIPPPSEVPLILPSALSAAVLYTRRWMPCVKQSISST